ncbi:hypothetical protein MMC10_006469 [Thelotrema lepadinum]|nr:hypothetical protein [Thelotrema lepadinum]
MKDDPPADCLISDPIKATPVQAALVSASLQGNTRYIYHRTWDIHCIDVAKLKLAMSEAFVKNDLLRSTFVVSGSNIYRVIRHSLALPWKECSTSLEDFCRNDLQQSIELGQAFIRVAVLNKSTLVVSLHHALFDFWSSLFDLNHIATCRDRLQPQIYQSFGSYQASLKSLDEESGKEFWQQYLADAEPSILNHAPTESVSELSRDVNIDLRDIYSSLRTSAGPVVYAAWAFLLSAHLDTRDVIFAAMVFRHESSFSDTDNLNGSSWIDVPLRVTIEETDSFSDLISRVNWNFGKTTEHCQFDVCKGFSAGGYQSGELFDTMVTVLSEGDQNVETRSALQLRDLQESRRRDCIALEAEERPDCVRIRLNGRMEQKRLGFLLEQMVKILAIMASYPRISLESTSILTDSEVAFLAPRILDVQPTETLHGGFEAAAKKFPDRIAIQWQRSEEITYRDLNIRANKLAAFLPKQGVTEGAAVPLLLEKSPLMIVAILAVMKLGAAYVPLCPENPVERNTDIISEAASASVLTDSKCSDLSNGVPGVSTIVLDREDWASCAPLQNAITVSPKHRAYLLYTSGTTGQPKGVTITHGACSTAMKSIIDFERKESGNFRALQFSNYVFDVSLYDIFVTLHTGGSLCMAPTHRLLDDLAGVINEMSVDHAFLTPTVARLLNPKAVPSMKSLTVGGEQVTQDVVNKWAPFVKLRNGYGPTECSVLVTMKDVGPSTLPRNIGSALPSVNAFILETNGTRLVPYGAVGELCFSGPQLSEGYFKRADLTDAVFQKTDCIPNVDRLYRSGDLARWLPHNELECLGRKDTQVKINGHRIELGEIENAFLKTGLVKECTAMTVERYGSSRLQLVAFVTFEGSTSDRTKEHVMPHSSTDSRERLLQLKASLRGLTPYMIPKKVIPLNSLPRSPSGKTNKKQLAEIMESMPLDKLAAYSFASIRSSEPKLSHSPKRTAGTCT